VQNRFWSAEPQDHTSGASQLCQRSIPNASFTARGCLPSFRLARRDLLRYSKQLILLFEEISMRLGTQKAEEAVSGVTIPRTHDVTFPEYEHDAINPKVFRDLLLRHGAVMLRNAADLKLLDEIEALLSKLFGQYDCLPADEFEKHLRSEDPIERDFWQQIKRSHIFDRTFREFAGFSYFNIIRSVNLWNLAQKAFPETELTESIVCNCRRVNVADLHRFWDQPISFHVDSQFFYDEKLSINFWTPLVPCGVNAPGLKLILIGVQDTKDYLEYNNVGYEPAPGDIARMHKFRCDKMDLDALQRNGLLKYMWAPAFNKGDVLAFTNFTMHATHFTSKMSLPRTSIEVRVDLPSVQF
jgi:hypothetical protein